MNPKSMCSCWWQWNSVRSRIVGDEIEFDFLETAEHHHVLDHAGGRLAADAHKFETVAVQMQRMDVVAGVAELQPVAASLMHGVHRLHRVHRERFAIEGPPVEAVDARHSA